MIGEGRVVLNLAKLTTDPASSVDCEFVTHPDSNSIENRLLEFQREVFEFDRLNDGGVASSAMPLWMGRSD